MLPAVPVPRPGLTRLCLEYLLQSQHRYLDLLLRGEEQRDSLQRSCPGRGDRGNASLPGTWRQAVDRLVGFLDTNFLVH